MSEIKEKSLPKDMSKDYCNCECDEGSYFISKGQDKYIPYATCFRCNACNLLVKVS
jgi:hypothetical protein